VVRTAPADTATVLTHTTARRLAMKKAGKSSDLLCSLVSPKSVELNIIMREVRMHPQDVCNHSISLVERADKHAATAVAMATVQTTVGTR
jgi:hypothetical protein